MKVTVAAVITLLLAGLCYAQAHSSTRDGVYTAEQATRGQSSYQKACASCHGETLDGVGQTPPLAGPDFTSHWIGQPISELFEKIQTSMPADRPGKISRAENADILAYVLRFNKFKAAKTELPSDPEGLKQIQFDAP